MTLSPLRRPALLIGVAIATGFAHPARAQEPPADSVRFYPSDDEMSVIPAGVVIPAGRGFVWTGGTGAPVFNDAAAPGTRERFGDTRIQAMGALRRIETQLTRLGLSLADVVYLRAYLVPDPTTGEIDSAGWDSAYRDFFGTDASPNRPARSTVGVTALVNPDGLIEIEAFAVAPE